MDPKTNFERVKQFHKACDSLDLERPGFPPAEIVNLRLDLIEEEYAELLTAIEDGDIVEVADALADILYVVYGTAGAFGINIDKIFEEVHRSNMTKVINGKVIKREDGKVLKPDSYTPANIKKVLDEQA